jgi:RNA polymerase sigma-70 factor (ECF subfamily)
MPRDLARRSSGGRLTDEDRREFETFYRASAEALARRARRLAGRDTPLAEELVQETYLRAARRWSDLALYEPSRRLGWVMVTLTNVFGDALRARSRAPDPAELVDEHPAADDPAVTGEMRVYYQLTVRAAVRVLKEPQLVVFLLTLSGWKSEEIASLLGIPSPTARWRLRRALDRIRKEPDIAAIGASLAGTGEEGS